MKKNIFYTALLVFFGGMIALIVMKYQSKEEQKKNITYQLLERKGALAEAKEWSFIKTEAAKLYKKLEQKPGDGKTLVLLANIMIMEARATGNYAYYDAVAMKYINDVLKNEPGNFEALTLRSVVLLSQHHFADGLAAAEAVRKINPYNSFVYGLLIDGNVEMGRYDSAVAAAEKMIDIRPDLRSYSRISYLREIHGDFPGAIEAMKMAVEAGADGDEATEWARVQLGHLYENTGNLQVSKLQYNIAANNRPGYTYALAGMGRIAMAEKKYDAALDYYQQADSLVSDGNFREDIADVYLALGKKDKADEVLKAAVAEMTKNADAANADENIGHYADRELAQAYIKLGDYDKAVKHALAEYNRRPGNIDVNETLAWAYFKDGDTGKAIQHIQKALLTGSKNPSLLCHAGLILSKSGNKEQAKKYLREALKNNPNILADLKIESNNTLAQL